VCRAHTPRAATLFLFATRQLVSVVLGRLYNQQDTGTAPSASASSRPSRITEDQDVSLSEISKISNLLEGSSLRAPKCCLPVATTHARDYEMLDR
jgi:hypothetical protein